MPWIRTPEAPHDPRHCRTLRFRLPLREIGSAASSTFDFGVNHSIHLHSGLQFPCLRFAVSVTTPHARLGTWLLARLCHGSHLRLQNFVRLKAQPPMNRSLKKALTQGPPSLTSCHSHAACPPGIATWIPDFLQTLRFSAGPTATLSPTSY